MALTKQYLDMLYAPLGGTTTAFATGPLTVNGLLTYGQSAFTPLVAAKLPNAYAVARSGYYYEFVSGTLSDFLLVGGGPVDGILITYPTNYNTYGYQEFHQSNGYVYKRTAASGTVWNAWTGPDIAGSGLPLTDGLGTSGTSGLLSRQDHVHPTDTGRSPISGPGSSQGFGVGYLSCTGIGSTGNISAQGVGHGGTVATDGTASATGYLQFLAANGVRQGYIGFSASTGAQDAGIIPYQAGTHQFLGAVTTSGNITVAGNVLGNSTSVVNMHATIPVNNSQRVNLGSPSVGELSMITSQASNKTQFLPYANFAAEYTTDDVTWNPIVAATNTIKSQVVSGRPGLGGGFNCTYGWTRMRLTFTAASYVYANWLYLYASTNGHTMGWRIQRSYDGSVWEDVSNDSNQCSSWPGHHFMAHSVIPWNPTPTLGTHYKYIRVIINPVWNGSFPANGISIYNVDWWGGYPAGKREIFDWDENKNVTFPANLSATAFNSITGLSASTPVVPSGAGVVGVATAAARGDHAHPSIAGNNTPSVDSGIGVTGINTSFSRQDHQHPLCAAYSPVAGPGSAQPFATGALTVTGAATATSFNSIIGLSAITPVVDSGTGVIGVSAAAARADHQHPSLAGNNNPLANAGGSSGGTSGANTSFSRQDHVHPPMVGTIRKLASTVVAGYSAVAASAIAANASAPTITAGTQVLSVSATAVVSTDKLIIRGVVQGQSTIANYVPAIAIWKDGTTLLGVSCGKLTIAGQVLPDQLSFEIEIAATDTSAHTYTVRLGDSGGAAMQLNGSATYNYGNTLTSYIIVEEKTV